MNALTIAPHSPNVLGYRLPDDTAEHIPAARLASVLRRQKWLLLGILICVMPPAVVVIEVLRPYYDAEALLMINTRNAEFRDLQATVATTDADAVAIGTQVGIIRSVEMAGRVVDRLNLTQNPEFTRVLDAPPSFTTHWTRKIATWFGVAAKPAPPLSAADRRQATAALLINDVTVVNDGHSYMITIKARSGDAALSAAIANTFSRAYLEYNRELKIAAIRRANSLLDDEMAPVRDRMHAADEAVETYRQKNGLITSHNPSADAAPGLGATISEEQLAQINAQLITAKGDLAAKQASLRQIKEALATGQLESVTEVMASPLIATLRAQQAELGTKLASVGQSAMRGNPSYQAAAAGSAAVQSRITAEVAKIARSVAGDVAVDEARIRTLNDALAGLKGQVAGESRANVSLRQLESEASAARGVYQDYLSRFEHTSSEGALQEPEADLISAANAPLGRTGPPKSQLIALVAVCTLLLGSLIALLRERLRTGVRTTEQLESSTGLFGLGLVPLAGRDLRHEFGSGQPSVYTGAIGHVASVLRYAGEQFRAKVVLVTSAAPGEGKTVFAISLAANVGREGGKALLIDCDLHRPSVAAALKLDKDALSEGEASSELVKLHQAALPGLDVLRFKPGAVHWSPMLCESLRRLIADARDRYDLIVLDAPPVLAFADAPILSLQADGAIMVVQWRRTPVAAVTSGVRLLRAYGVRLLGGVVTQVKIKDLDATEGGHAHLYRAHVGYFQ